MNLLVIIFVLFCLFYFVCFSFKKSLSSCEKGGNEFFCTTFQVFLASEVKDGGTGRERRRRKAQRREKKAKKQEKKERKRTNQERKKKKKRKAVE